MGQIIANTISYVKKQLADAEAGHDWLHIERVYRNALNINSTEKGDPVVVALAALLHDIADSKFYNGDEELGPDMARNFLVSQQVSPQVIEHVVLIIRNLSFKASLGGVTFQSRELDIVQDADRLDAIGAIGVARAFTYGGFTSRVMYDPDVMPNLHMSKQEYKAAKGPTINHFYEKLLLLKDLMRTSAGKAMAAERHEFMLRFLEQFGKEAGLPK
ncbi:HD domain-containing protein [Pedobacter faecalis]|uniref:HD domain-containing protein n=1 Tax=Pedobacter faecalis TaxID=3041495 RepID=UPI00254C4C9B|nr:HD domain-containing protein [Pedobacter sp. ELA7]